MCEGFLVFGSLQTPFMPRRIAPGLLPGGVANPTAGGIAGFGGRIDTGRSYGVIGGSGHLRNRWFGRCAWISVDSPWGAPSDELLTGVLGGVRMVFLPRHGRGHVHSPSTVPYRANIDALKRLGVTDVISVSACGSFREEMAPGEFVIVDQFIDRTFAREKSFFGTGCVAHVSVAHPYL